MRNGCPVFAENRPWSDNREIGLFAKGAFCAFFWPHFLQAVFSRLCSSVSWQDSRGGGYTRNATKQGVSERFHVFLSLRALLARWKCVILRTFLEDNFFQCVTVFYVSKFEILTKLGFQSKKALGAAEPSSFRKGHFLHFVRCARKFDARWARGRVGFSVGFGVVAKNARAASVRRFSASFPVFFCDPVFANFKWSSSQSPSFCLGVLFFIRIFFGNGGNTALHVCFWAVGLQSFIFSWFLGFFLQNHCFPAENIKRVSLVHFSVSPLVLLGFFFSLFFVALFFLFFSSLVVLSLFYPSSFLLSFFVLFRFCFTKRTTSKYYILRFLS